MTKKSVLINGIDYWTIFGQRLTDLMEFKEGSKVLDIGTGRGACLIPVAKKIGPTGYVIGIDLWTNMIEATNEKIKSNNLTNAHAEIMDARKLTYDESTFDYTTCGFIGFSGIYDFQNNKYRSNNDIMKHILRVLKSGGIAGFSTWLKQEELDCLRELIQEYLSNYTSSSKREINDVPISYSKETIEGFEKIMVDIGFNDIEISSEEFVLKYNSIDKWFEKMNQVGWILNRIIGPDKNKIQKFKEKMLPDGLEPYKKNNGFHFIKEIIFAFGKK